LSGSAFFLSGPGNTRKQNVAAHLARDGSGIS
jgi:hypothetical protein